MSALSGAEGDLCRDDYVGIHELFRLSSHGADLQGTTRWDDYRPEHVTREEWMLELGANVDDVEHHPYMFVVTEEFVRQCNEALDSHPDANFNTRETTVLLLCAITNNWADSHPEVGNIGVEKRDAEHTEREKQAWQDYVAELLPELDPTLKREVFDTLFDMRVETKLGRAWDAIQRITYLHDIIRAAEFAHKTDDKELKAHLDWMQAAGIKNQTEVLMEYAKTYKPVAGVLAVNAEVLSAIYDELDPDILFTLGREQTHKQNQFLDAGRRWRESTFANTIETPAPTRIEKITSFEELFESLSRVVFRGIFDAQGRPIQPYKDAKFTVATVLPSNTKMNPPTLRIGAREEELYTPQPTIYANQTDIIETVSRYLEEQGISIFDLPGAIEYFWPGRGRYNILPPVVEKHRFMLDAGNIDIDDLAAQFAGMYLRDAKGNLHEMSQRYLTGFYVDEMSPSPHFDIFNSNVPLLNYGRQSTGPWDFNIVCDGDHRIDFAIEDNGRPTSVILVEPNGDTPLIPYYALPMPFRPKIRLSSKRAEVLHPKLERDKFHLLQDLIRKTLHYDWEPAGLNVSSLRGGSN